MTDAIDSRVHDFEVGDRVTMRYGIGTVGAVWPDAIMVAADVGGFWACAPEDAERIEEEQ